MVVVLCGLFLIHQDAAFAAAAPNRQTDLVETSEGALKITPLLRGRPSVLSDAGTGQPQQDERQAPGC